MSTFARWIIGLFASPLGVFVLAALDSTIFFSLPFGIDAVVVILGAREGGLAWMIALLATAGSVAGAALTFWMGARLGEQGLERLVPPRRLKRVHARVRNTGAVALAVLDLIPPPFPFTPFVLAAGALEVDSATFFITLALCRLARFGAEALLAVHYSRRMLALLESDLFHDVVAVCIVLAIIASIVTVVRLLLVTHSPERRKHTKAGRGASNTSDRRSAPRARA